MGCDQSTPVQDTYSRPPPNTGTNPRPVNRQPQGATRQTAANQGNTRATAAAKAKATDKVNKTTGAAKKAQLKQRVQAKKQTPEYRKKHAELQQKKRAAAIQAGKVKIENKNPDTSLKRDISEYKHKSATYGGNSDAPQDENQFLKQVEELIPAEVRMISGCEDEQTSTDVMNAAGNLPNPKGRAGGAATSALLELLYKHQNEKFSFQDALIALREKLKSEGHTQIPQLTSSRPLDLDETPFSFHASNENEDSIRRALLVGINYVGQQGQLRGCHNDVYHMKDYLINMHGFHESNIVVVTDDGSGKQPTRKQIIDELIFLTKVSKAGDSVFFHYSGHGGFLEADQNSLKQKQEQYDQTLIPLDHRHAGQIRDFNLFNHFVRPMKAGVAVTCLMDCCHSGSVLDLPYSFKPTAEGKGAYRQEANVADIAGIAFLAVLAGVVLDSLIFDSVFDTLQHTLECDVLDVYGGLYANMLYEDLVERAVEDYIEDEIEREIEYEVEREIEREIEMEVQREIEREIEREIQKEVEREIQREIEREIQREAEREIQRELEREMQREVEREIENEVANAMFDDAFGGGGSGYNDFW